MDNLMSNEKLRKLLSFEANLKKVEILSQTKLEKNAYHIAARLTYPDYVYEVPFVWYKGEEWLFTPDDWQSYPSLEVEDIPKIPWRVNDTDISAILLNGLPRLFM